MPDCLLGLQDQAVVTASGLQRPLFHKVVLKEFDTSQLTALSNCVSTSLITNSCGRLTLIKQPTSNN